MPRSIVSRRRRRSTGTITLILGAALGLFTPVGAVSGETREADPPVRITPHGDAILTVDGNRYRGSIEISRDGDGLKVVNVVGVDEYLQGLAEMPSGWPRAALEAQAVVDRTLLARVLGAGRRTGAGESDIDADAAGAPPYRGVVAESPEWAAAFDATAGQVVGSGSRPDEVHSHATSLSDTGAGTPLAAWTVRIPRADLNEVLPAGGLALPGGAGVTAVGVQSGEVVVSTDAGDARVSTDTFARAVNTGAPRRFPDRYPGTTDEDVEAGLTGGDGWGGPWPMPPRPEGDTTKRLPLTLVSPHFDVATDGGDLVFTGRGWGSGLGMSKTSARRAAEAGRSGGDILGEAFPGRTPTRGEDIDGDVRVGLARGVAEVRIGAEGGFFRIEGEAGAVAQAAFGDWQATPGPDDSIALAGPDGAGTALAVDGFTVPLRMVSNRRLPVEFTLSRPAEVEVVVEGPLGNGSRTERRDLGVLPAGEATQVGLDDLPAGAYRVTVEASAGDESVSTGPLTVDVTPVRRGPSLAGLIGLVAVLTVLLVGAIAARGRRRMRRSPPAARGA